MKQAMQTLLALMLGMILSVSSALAQEPEVCVVVPDHPDGVVVTGCYRAVGRIYDSYRFEFCLKRRGTYTVTGGGLRCEGRLRWELSGPGVDVDLRRTSCGRGKAWSADSMWCRPNLLIGFLAAIAKARQPLLAALNCDYRPARGTGEKPISFVARRL